MVRAPVGDVFSGVNLSFTSMNSASSLLMVSLYSEKFSSEADQGFLDRGFDLLTLPDFSLILPDFSENSP